MTIFTQVPAELLAPWLPLEQAQQVSAHVLHGGAFGQLSFDIGQIGVQIIDARFTRFRLLKDKRVDSIQ